MLVLNKQFTTNFTRYKEQLHANQKLTSEPQSPLEPPPPPPLVFKVWKVTSETELHIYIYIYIYINTSHCLIKNKYLKERKTSLVILQIQKKGPKSQPFYRSDTGETSVMNELVINQRQNARNVMVAQINHAFFFITAECKHSYQTDQKTWNFTDRIYSPL